MNGGPPLTHAGGGSRRHIVLLEPHDDSRDLYAEWLTWRGMRVTAAATATHALQVIDHAAPDAVVAALRLPEFDGFAVCDLMRAVPRTAHIPIIAFSTCMADYVRAVADGRFAGVLMKPSLPHELSDCLDAILARAHRTNAPPVEQLALRCSVPG